MDILRYCLGSACDITKALLTLWKLSCLFLGLGVAMVPGVAGVFVARLGMRSLGLRLLETSRLMVVRIDKGINDLGRE